MIICEKLKEYCKKDIACCTNHEIYIALLDLVGEYAKQRRKDDKKKKLYYLSMEFLIGKLLSNNLINLGIYDEVKECLEKNGKSLAEIEEEETEPSLGNGGLGRLAACFMDSVATLGLNGCGVGLNYHYGFFRQVFKDNEQIETPDCWIENNSWLIKTDTVYDIELGDKKVRSRMYDIAVTGYDSSTNYLHLFDLEGVSDEITGDGTDFDKNDIEKNLTLFLYPDDSDESGRLLRLYQQYFMVSSAAQLIIDECIEKGCTLYDLPDYAVIQINDTHPTLIIPELIRLLCKRGIDMDSAIDAVRRSCAYTNHTILAEALEKWQLDYIRRVAPALVPIIEVLDNRVRRAFDDETVHIIDRDERVHMANIDIHYGFSVNSVAALHLDVLKKSEMKNFYTIYPEKFNNKTNGITFRRWLIHCNPELTEFISELIGDDYKKDASKLKELESFAGDESVLKRLLEIKSANKHKLIKYLDMDIDENSVFDVQIKRLHEYKRQQMNVLYLIHKYFEIKSGVIPPVPITAIFGAKAAPAYTIAKDIIHLILCFADLVNSDTEVNKYLKIIMVENYNVSRAEKIIPACDISEQISLASKEASGTGNMKCMLNGAITLGTDDGANVEIHSLVGDENIYIFGASSDEVIDRYRNGSYNPFEYYENDTEIRRAVDFITNKALIERGNSEKLGRLKNELLHKDYFMTFPDFNSYVKTKDKMISDYTDRMSWAKKMIINISNAGYFSADRTIADYNRDIWKL